MFSPSRIISLLLFCAACSVVSLAQDKYQVTSEYDRFKDVTTFGLEPIPTSDAATLIFAVFQCPGQKSCQPDRIIFGFAVITLHDEPYEGRGIARMIRDGIRSEPYQLKYLGYKTRIIPLPAHVFMAQIRPEGLIKTANSKLVEYQIDSLEFSLTSENLAGLRALANRMQ